MLISRIPLALVLGVVLAFSVAGRTAKAAVIYTYTGNDFHAFNNSPPVTASDFISATFTFANALPDNLVNAEETSVVTDWSISDQITTLSQENSNLLFFAQFSTDATGDITSWVISAFNSTGCPEDFITGCLKMLTDNPPEGDEVDSSTGTDIGWSAGVTNNPGAWGVGGLGGSGRKTITHSCGAGGHLAPPPA